MSDYFYSFEFCVLKNGQDHGGMAWVELIHNLGELAEEENQ